MGFQQGLKSFLWLFIWINIQGLNVAVPFFHYLSYGIHSLSWTDVIEIDVLWFFLWESHWSGSQHDSANTCHDWAEGVQNNGRMSKKRVKTGARSQCWYHSACFVTLGPEFRWGDTPTMDFSLDMWQIQLTLVQCSSSKLYFLKRKLHVQHHSVLSVAAVSHWAGRAVMGWLCWVLKVQQHYLKT